MRGAVWHEEDGNSRKQEKACAQANASDQTVLGSNPTKDKWCEGGYPPADIEAKSCAGGAHMRRKEFGKISAEQAREGNEKGIHRA